MKAIFCALGSVALALGLLAATPNPPARALDPDDARADVYAFAENDGGKTAVHVLNASGNYQSYSLQIRTAQGETSGTQWQHGVGDFNGDGISDVYNLSGNNGGFTTVHVLNGADNFQTFLLQTLTVLPATTDPRWELRVADYNADGRADVYAINKIGSGMTNVHILDAATNFQSFLLETNTAIAATNDPVWDLEVGDYDGDGMADIYAMNKNDGGSTAVHVLDAASNFATFTMHTKSAMHFTTDP